MFKKWLLRFLSITFILFLLMFSFAAVQNKMNKFEKMVGATVLIFDEQGHASGVFIADNIILTAGHCVRHRNSKPLKIELSNGKIVVSDDFYFDEKEDIGFIYVDVNEPAIAKISRMLYRVGDDVFVVGTPYHKENKFSLFKGVISFIGRNSSFYDKWNNLIQVDADSGPGNSGGPLYNSKGELIGMYVGQTDGGGLSISLCENIDNILRAFKEYKSKRVE